MPKSSTQIHANSRATYPAVTVCFDHCGKLRGKPRNARAAIRTFKLCISTRGVAVCCASISVAHGRLRYALWIRANLASIQLDRSLGGSHRRWEVERTFTMRFAGRLFVRACATAVLVALMFALSVGAQGQQSPAGQAPPTAPAGAAPAGPPP